MCKVWQLGGRKLPSTHACKAHALRCLAPTLHIACRSTCFLPTFYVEPAVMARADEELLLPAHVDVGVALQGPTDTSLVHDSRPGRLSWGGERGKRC